MKPSEIIHFIGDSFESGKKCRLEGGVVVELHTPRPHTQSTVMRQKFAADVARVCTNRHELYNPDIYSDDIHLEVCQIKNSSLVKSLIERSHNSVFEFFRLPRDKGLDYSLRNNVCFDYDHESYKEKVEDHQALFKITAPIFVPRQIMRHRAFTFMEKSRRMVRGDLCFWKPEKGFFARLIFKLSEFAAKLNYNLLLLVVKPEIARAVLPVSLLTTFLMIGDAKAYAGLFLQRCTTHAQKQTRDICEQMEAALKEYQPEFYKKVLFEKQQISEQNESLKPQFCRFFGLS